MLKNVTGDTEPDDILSGTICEGWSVLRSSGLGRRMPAILDSKRPRSLEADRSIIHHLFSKIK